MKNPLRLIGLCCLLLSSNAFAQQQEARKFDSVGQLNCEDAKARLDNWGVELQNNPGAKGYLIFYGGKSYSNLVYNRRTRRYVTVQLAPTRSEAKARIAPWKPYLVNNRGLDGARIEVVNGGYREKPMTEMWIVPAGAKPPTLHPTLSEKKIKFRKGRVNFNEMAFGC